MGSLNTPSKIRIILPTNAQEKSTSSYYWYISSLLDQLTTDNTFSVQEEFKLYYTEMKLPTPLAFRAGKAKNFSLTDSDESKDFGTPEMKTNNIFMEPYFQAYIFGNNLSTYFLNG